MLKKLNFHCYSYQVKKQFYHTNSVRVLTVSDLQRKALRVPTEFGVRVILTGACQNTEVNFSLLPI